MPERPESPYVLEQKEKLKQLLEKRKQLKFSIQSAIERGGSTYDMDRNQTLNEIKIKQTRRDIRADRMRDRRASGYRDIEKAAIKRRKREDSLQVREYLATEAEQYKPSAAFLIYYRCIYGDKNPREPYCFTCGQPLKAGDEVYRLNTQEAFVFIHVWHKKTLAKKELIEDDRFRREKRMVFPLTLEDELYMRDFVKGYEAVEQEKRKNEPKIIPVSRVNNLQRVRDGRSRVVG